MLYDMTAEMIIPVASDEVARHDTGVYTVSAE